MNDLKISLSGKFFAEHMFLNDVMPVFALFTPSNVWQNKAKCDTVFCSPLEHKGHNLSLCNFPGLGYRCPKLAALYRNKVMYSLEVPSFTCLAFLKHFISRSQGRESLDRDSLVLATKWSFMWFDNLEPEGNEKRPSSIRTLCRCLR